MSKGGFSFVCVASRVITFLEEVECRREGFNVLSFSSVRLLLTK